MANDNLGGDISRLIGGARVTRDVVIGVTELSTSAPAAPVLGTPTVTSSSVTAVATNGNGAASYETRVSYDSGSTYSTPVSGLTVTGISASTSGILEVRGLTSGGTAGAWSSTVSFTTSAGTATAPGAPTIGSTTASIPFTYNDTDLTGFQYAVDGGTWTALNASPVTLSGLTAATTYSVAIRAINASGNGTAVTASITTTTAIDTVPDAFSFTAITGAALSATVASNVITVTGVSAGTDIPTSITGGSYAVSTDGGKTFGGWTTAATNVRLNYKIKVEVSASGAPNTPVSATLTIGGVSGTFSVTTAPDTTAPAIMLTGGNITLVVGSTFIEPGYTATDNIDGDVTSQVVVTGTVDTSKVGVYILTYTVSDAAGNVGTATRTVTVAAPTFVTSYLTGTIGLYPPTGNSTQALLVGNSMELTLENLAEADGTLTPDATVNATIYESDGTTQVSGATWPVSLAYTSGVYSTSLPYDLAITAGQSYYIEMTATLGNARLDESLLVPAQKRWAS